MEGSVDEVVVDVYLLVSPCQGVDLEEVGDLMFDEARYVKLARSAVYMVAISFNKYIWQFEIRQEMINYFFICMFMVMLLVMAYVEVY